MSIDDEGPRRRRPLNSSSTTSQSITANGYHETNGKHHPPTVVDNNNESPIIQNSLLRLMCNNAFLLLMTVRTLSAAFNLVWDCDEVYNYWEPLHFLLYGHGFQTWEYSPVYSLRSYLYIILHSFPMMPAVRHQLLEKRTMFFLLRFIFAIVTSLCESALFNALYNKKTKLVHKKKFYQRTALYFLLFSLVNAGMFLSSTAFLPSTFVMYCVTIAYSSLLTHSYATAIFSIALGTLLGWPFVAILGVPVVIEVCLFAFSDDDEAETEHGRPSSIGLNILSFSLWSLIFGVSILGVMILVDSYMFGKLTIAPWNIFKYNVFPDSDAHGPDLYGREPFSYYVLNCLLNFNVLFPFALLGAFCTVLSYKTYGKFFVWVTLGMSLWMAVFFTRPHKEERFLYPIYPLVLLSASAALHHVHQAMSRMIGKVANMLPLVIIVVHAILSVMRVLALLKAYSSSMEIYHVLNQPSIKHSMPYLNEKEVINVCVGKEWYRFPSNFFIPETVQTAAKKQKWRLRFLESDFKGQLPGYFNESVHVPQSTRHVDKLFNDENKEVRARYTQLSKCQFFIDTDNDGGDRDQVGAISQLSYNNKDTETKWKLLAKFPFLDPRVSTKGFFKSFYVPKFFESKNIFTYFKLRVRIP